MKSPGHFSDLSSRYGNRIVANDAVIGRVVDFYFEDGTWAIRYVVADTGHWLRQRQVLLSPHAFAAWEPTRGSWNVHLTQEQVENSPEIAEHLPVSRQFEERYCQYYGWPAYWKEMDHLGPAGFVVAGKPDPRFPQSESVSPPDIHLRSTKAVTGYEVHGIDGLVGRVAGFRMDDVHWKLVELILDPDPDLAGEAIRIPTGKIARIAAAESKVWVHLTRPEVEATIALQTGGTN